jgi:hypothetical protein
MLCCWLLIPLLLVSDLFAIVIFLVQFVPADGLLDRLMVLTLVQVFLFFSSRVQVFLLGWFSSLHNAFKKMGKFSHIAD